MAANLYVYWLQALEAPLGIYLRTPDPTRLKGLLYSARAKANDLTIAHLVIRTSPVDKEHEIWIIKGPETSATRVSDAC